MEVEHINPLKSLQVRTRRLPEVLLELTDEVGEAAIPYTSGCLADGVILQEQAACMFKAQLLQELIGRRASAMLEEMSER